MQSNVRMCGVQEQMTRLGRWIDFKNDYKTMYPSFMESVWWVFKQLYLKGLVYRGHKVRPPNHLQISVLFLSRIRSAPGLTAPSIGVMNFDLSIPSRLILPIRIIPAPLQRLEPSLNRADKLRAPVLPPGSVLAIGIYRIYRSRSFPCTRVMSSNLPFYWGHKTLVE